MPQFAYQALDSSGSQLSGEVVAPDEVAALDRITDQGLTPFRLTKGGAQEHWWSRDITLFGEPELKSIEIARFFDMLSPMLATKTPLPTALEFCANFTDDKTMKRKIATAISGVKDGMSLAEALEQTRPAFPTQLIAQIKTGEASNALEAVVGRISGTLNDEADLSREVRQALIYPIILMGMSLFVLAILIFYLAPTLAPVFADANAPTPVVIELMTDLERFARGNWVLLLLGTASLLTVLLIVRSEVRGFLVALLVRTPFGRRYLSKRETLRFCQTLHLMLMSGAQLSDALKTAAETTQSRPWRSALNEVYLRLEAGDAFTSALEEQGLLDPLALAMLKTGEQTDRMSEVLPPTIRSLQTQTKQTLSQIVALLTPVLTLLIGIAVGGIILTTISAILDLNNAAL